MRTTEDTRRRAARNYAESLRMCAFAADGYLGACAKDGIEVEGLETYTGDAMRVLAKALEREAITGEHRLLGGAT